MWRLKTTFVVVWLLSTISQHPVSSGFYILETGKCETPTCLNVQKEYRKDFDTRVRNAIETLGLEALPRNISSASAIGKNSVNIFWGYHENNLSKYQQEPLSSSLFINMIPGVGKYIFGDKDCFQTLFESAANKNGYQWIFDFIPRSFSLSASVLSPSEFRRISSQVNESEFWILKKTNSWSGRGVSVVSSASVLSLINQVQSGSKHENFHDSVIQRYIEKPLLLNGHKFDTRWWVLVSSVDPFRVFVIPNAYVRAAKHKYTLSLKALGDKCVHVTNGEVQKRCSQKQTKNVQGLKSARNLPFNTSDFPFKWEDFYSKTKLVILKSLLVALSELRHYNRLYCKTRCFQLLSYDIIYENRHRSGMDGVNPFIEEINVNGYLGSGIYAVRNSETEDYLLDMFRLLRVSNHNATARHVSSNVQTEKICSAVEYDLTKFKDSETNDGTPCFFRNQKQLIIDIGEYKNRGVWEPLFMLSKIPLEVLEIVRTYFSPDEVDEVIQTEKLIYALEP